MFRRLGDAQRVMREQFTNPFRIGDRTLRVLYSEGSNITSLLHRPVTGRTIWVSNIPYAATSRELKALFAPYGVIRHLNLRACLLALFILHLIQVRPNSL